MTRGRWACQLKAALVVGGSRWHVGAPKFLPELGVGENLSSLGSEALPIPRDPSLSALESRFLYLEDGMTLWASWISPGLGEALTCGRSYGRVPRCIIPAK